MTDPAELPFVTEVIEARRHSELVVEHVCEAVTDDEVEQYSTGDDNDSDDAESVMVPESAAIPAEVLTKAKLRVPYQFVPPEIQPQNVAAAKPKPKPKPAARQPSMAAFLAQK